MKNRWIFGICCLVAFLLLLAAYSDYFDNSFHFDDAHVIQNNLYIRDIRNLPQFFQDAGTSSSLPVNAGYRPLVTSSLALDYWLGRGLDPFQFHLTQFVLLVLLGAILFFFYRAVMNQGASGQSNSYLALFAATFFCLHTANTETLNIISARSEFLSTLGVIGSFLMYFHLKWTRRFYLYLVPMALGALAKTPAVMFAPLLFVFVLLFEEENLGWKSLARTIKKTLPAFALGLFLFWFVESMKHPSVVLAVINRWDYALTQPFIWLHYVKLFLLPVGLTADTDWKVLEHWYDTRLFIGVLATFILLRLTWDFSKKPKMKPAAFGLAWFMLALLPASSIFPLSEVANEHRIFFPYIGLTLAVFWWITQKVRQKGGVFVPAAGVLAFMVFFGHAWGTYERNKVWKTEETLWADVVKKSPGNGRAIMNYGLALMARGQLQRAKDLFNQALVFTPNYPHLETNLGVVNGALGDHVEAEKHFLRALQLNPNFAEGHFHYARWLLGQKRRDEAVAHLKTAVAISPGLAPARELLKKLSYENP